MFKKLKKMFTEVFNVDFATVKDNLKTTLMVIFFTASMSIIIYGVDMAISQLMSYTYKI